MWTELTLENVAYVPSSPIEYTSQGVAKVGRWWVHSFDPSPQSEPEQFTTAELHLEVKYLMRLNKREGSHHLRTLAYLRLMDIIADRNRAHI